jgi:hypothetical protein
MKNEVQYVVERWPHGWLVCSAPGQTGVPVTAVSECQPVFPRRAIMCPGIAHHYNACGHASHVIMAVADVKGYAAWDKEICASLSHLEPEARWWKGTDVGRSAAAIFAVFSAGFWAQRADDFAKGATPQDAADFGRCLRLLNLFPTWRARLHEVAEVYPETKWPAIVARWEEIEAASPEQQTEILRTI